MATSNPRKRLWNEYSKLKTWAAGTDPASKSCSVESCSLEDEEAMISSTPSDQAAALSKELQHMSINALIYPSSEPFEQRGLRVEIQVPVAYPLAPPQVYMRTSIRHPNIDKNGLICCALLDTTKKWIETSLADIVTTIIKLIDQPDKGYALDAEMGSLYVADISNYNRQIMGMSRQYGIPRN